MAGSPHSRIRITARIGGSPGLGTRQTARPRHTPARPERNPRLKKNSQNTPATRAPAPNLTRSRIARPGRPETPAVGTLLSGWIASRGCAPTKGRRHGLASRCIHHSATRGIQRAEAGPLTSRQNSKTSKLFRKRTRFQHYDQTPISRRVPRSRIREGSTALCLWGTGCTDISDVDVHITNARVMTLRPDINLKCSVLYFRQIVLGGLPARKQYE